MKIKDCLSDFQKGNLEKLSDYLLSGHLDADFNMKRYSEHGNEEFSQDRTCGSVGCAVGHGPYAGIEVGQANDWTEYCAKNFVGLKFEELWEYLFSGEWAAYDDTAEGAAKRIRFVLNNLEMEEKNLERVMPWVEDYQ